MYGNQNNTEKLYNNTELKVRCSCNVPGTGEERDILRLGKSDYFGERALLMNEPRAANVIAVGDVDCLVLVRSDFVKLLGPLQAILGREAERREQVREVAVLCVGRMGMG